MRIDSAVLNWAFILILPVYLVSECRKLRDDQLIYLLDFEKGNLADWHEKKLPELESARVVRHPVRAGKYAVRFQLKRLDRIVSKSKRAELQMSGAGYAGQEFWYGLSVFIPNDWEEDSADEVVVQWNANHDKELGESPKRSPPLAIRIRKDYWFVTNRWDARAVTPPGNTAPGAILWRGPYARGAWTDWVVHARWSYKPDGLLEIWKNGEKIVRKDGPNTYNDRYGLRFKIGIYKPKWNDPAARSDVLVRTVYHDEIRVGGRGADYLMVAPE